MSEKKKSFTFHVSKTWHFEFEVWGTSEEEARKSGIRIWCSAPTTGDWELLNKETEYQIVENVQP